MQGSGYSPYYRLASFKNDLCHTSHQSLDNGSQGNPIRPVGTMRGYWALLGLVGLPWLPLPRLEWLIRSMSFLDLPEL